MCARRSPQACRPATLERRARAARWPVGDGGCRFRRDFLGGPGPLACRAAVLRVRFSYLKTVELAGLTTVTPALSLWFRSLIRWEYLFSALAKKWPGARDLSRRNPCTADPRREISSRHRQPTFLRTKVRAPFACPAIRLNRYSPWGEGQGEGEILGLTCQAALFLIFHKGAPVAILMVCRQLAGPT